MTIKIIKAVNLQPLMCFIFILFSYSFFYIYIYINIARVTSTLESLMHSEIQLGC